jgi:hypothetical protein
MDFPSRQEAMSPSAAEPAVIVLSSLVAGSRVGGGVAALVMARAGIVPEHVPTVTFGRHPGLGAPGGAAVSDEAFAGALDGLIANGRHRAARAILTGYFASPAQVRAAADLIDRARAETLDILVLVDPILGDGAPDGSGAGLYVRPETAAAVADLLIARRVRKAASKALGVMSREDLGDRTAGVVGNQIDRGEVQGVADIEHRTGEGGERELLVGMRWRSAVQREVQRDATALILHLPDHLPPQVATGRQAVDEQRGQAVADLHVADRPGPGLDCLPVGIELIDVHRSVPFCR